MKKAYIIAFVLFVIAIIYRVYGLHASIPLWVDEFSTARTARNLIEYGPRIFLFPGTLLVEGHNYTTYSLAALSLSLFGQTPFALRLPFAIIGAATISLLFLSMVRITKSHAAAFATAVLAATSYNIITWSRQAREYSLLQFLTVAFLYCATYLSVSDKKIRKKAVLLCVLIDLLGILTHVFFYLFIASVAVYYGSLNRPHLLKWLRQSSLHVAIAIGALILCCYIVYRQGVLGLFTNQLFLANNLWYYHSYLWRQYGLLTTLGVTGLIIMLRKRVPLSGIMIIHFVAHFIFITFIFTHYITKYLEPILLYLYIGMGYIIWHVSQSVFLTKQKMNAAIVCIAAACILVANGNMFVLKPKAYYSLNRDFREVANIDYDQIYSVIEPIAKSDPSTAIIETWPDRAFWYLGNRYPTIYLFRWENESGRSNGQMHKTPFYYNSQKEKEIAPGVRFISTVSDLKKTMRKYPKGFLFIDDTSLPKDVLDYAKSHLKKEIYLDHYPLDENPYSIWPATLYSWGIAQ